MHANEAARLEVAVGEAARSHVVQKVDGDGMLPMPARANAASGPAAQARLRWKSFASHSDLHPDYPYRPVHPSLAGETMVLSLTNLGFFVMYEANADEERVDHLQAPEAKQQP
jgi:hypothetical protein